MAVRLWIVERAIDRAQRHAVEASSKMQQQIHASTQRTLAEQQKQREARQVLEQANRQSMADADSERARAYRTGIAERERKERAWAPRCRPGGAKSRRGSTAIRARGAAG